MQKNYHIKSMSNTKPKQDMYASNYLVSIKQKLYAIKDKHICKLN